MKRKKIKKEKTDLYYQNIIDNAPMIAKEVAEMYAEDLKVQHEIHHREILKRAILEYEKAQD